MPVTKIISGGQTGADQAGLYAGQDLGVAAGGFMPKGWRTEVGPRPEAESMGLTCMTDGGYTLRTMMNVDNSDGTLWFGKTYSPGYRHTYRCAQKAGRPIIEIPWPGGKALPLASKIPLMLRWLAQHDIKILNVAGNRESKNPGIFIACRAFIIAAVGKYNEEKSDG